MPGALIVIDQDRPSGTSFGSPGVARNDLWLSRTIRPRCGTSGNTSFLWSLLAVPPTSTVTLNGSATATPDFDPDVAGNYRLQLVTNGGGPGNIQILVCSVRFDSAGTLLNRGWAPPAFGETSAEDNFSGNTRGYAPAFEFIFNDILSVIGALPVSPGDATSIQGATVPAGPLTTFDVLQATSTTTLGYGLITDNNIAVGANIQCAKLDGVFSGGVSGGGNAQFFGVRNTGFVSLAVRHVTSDDTILLGLDYALAVDAHVGTLTLTIQAIVPTESFELLIFDDAGSAATNNVVVDGAGQTINGAATYTISTNNGFVRLLWTGTEYRIVGTA